MALNFFRDYDDRIEIEGVMYNIDMRFDTVMRFIYLLKDDELSDRVKLNQALKLMIDDTLTDYPISTQHEALVALVNYVEGEDKVVHYDLRGNVIPTPYEEPVTDYEQDFDYIYAGFIQTYGIDLLEQWDMDWRKFKALLKSLPKGTKYREVIEIRQMDSANYKGKDKEQIERAKRHYALKK
ncbi:bacteriophage Gp15 family protein [Aerococcaceae bacterium NML160702]|nr:bacteriophage Gp15 family protein [Aerococcaceae bacterium NML160702]